MAYQPPPVDINVLITVPSSSTDTQSRPLISTERRLTPTWTISQLKTKLEPITGIPSSGQFLRTTLLDGTVAVFEDDESYLNDPRYGLRKGSEIEVIDTRPAGARVDLMDVSNVAKYEMPVEQYERLDDSVLAWKKRQRLGRFDPSAKSPDELIAERKAADLQIVQNRGILVGERCRVGREDTRRGLVRFVGEIEGLGGEREVGCVWVGVELDEPSGRNDGSAEVKVDGRSVTKRIFECKDGFGVFARPEKIEAGDFPPYDDLLDEDMEEL